MVPPRAAEEIAVSLSLQKDAHNVLSIMKFTKNELVEAFPALEHLLSDLGVGKRIKIITELKEVPDGHVPEPPHNPKVNRKMFTFLLEAGDGKLPTIKAQYDTMPSIAYRSLTLYFPIGVLTGMLEDYDKQWTTSHVPTSKILADYKFQKFQTVVDAFLHKP